MMKKKKEKPWKRIITGIIAVIVILGVFGIRFWDFNRANAACLAYKDAEAGTMKVPYMYLDHEDIFDLWNGRDIGNDVNVLLSGGLTYTRNDLKILPSNDGGLDIKNSNGDGISLDVNASSLNLMDDVLIYRDDNDRNIYSYDLKEKKKNLLLEGNIGEVFVSDGIIYYIDLDSHSSIVSMNLDGKDTSTVIDIPTDSFAVCGDEIVFLDTSQRLFHVGLSEDKPNLLVRDVERFYIDGRIYAESKNTIFSFAPRGNHASKEYETDNDTMRFVDVFAGMIFIQEDDTLKYISGGSAVETEVSNHFLYSAISQSEDGSAYLAAYTEGKDSKIKKELIEFSIPSS